jgi:hypothetical protein
MYLSAAYRPQLSQPFSQSLQCIVPTALNKYWQLPSPD